MDARPVDAAGADLHLNKNQWRAHFKQKLNAIAEPAAQNLSKSIQDNLQLLISNAEGPIGVFSNLEGEPQLKELIQKLDLDWCFPKVIGDQMKFYRSSWDDLQTGAYGVLEPKAKKEVLVKQLKWCLVPGLGFDRKGVRMGRGKAFYDKALAKTQCVRVGVGFTEQVITESLPKEKHDISMHWIVTEKYLLKLSNRKSRG